MVSKKKKKVSEHGIYYLVLCPYDIQFNQESHLNNKKYFNNIIKLNNKKMITTKRKKNDFKLHDKCTLRNTKNLSKITTTKPLFQILGLVIDS